MRNSIEIARRAVAFVIVIILLPLAILYLLCLFSLDPILKRGVIGSFKYDYIDEQEIINMEVPYNSEKVREVKL